MCGQTCRNFKAKAALVFPDWLARKAASFVGSMIKGMEATSTNQVVQF